MKAPAGYPNRHREVIRATWRFALWTIGLTGGPTIVLAIAAIYWHWQGAVVPAAIAAAIFLVATYKVAFLSLWHSYWYVRVIPYFERPVGGIDTFLRGAALAHHMQQLDALAAETGTTRLSAFGFGDDLFGETVVWHTAGDGLRSVRALLEAVELRPDRVEHVQDVIGDLRHMAEALRKARDHEIRFSLLLRHGNSTSALEWEKRQGTAF